MKRFSNFLLMVVMFITITSIGANAQGRGNAYGHQKHDRKDDKHDRREHSDRKNDRDYSKNDRDHHHDRHSNRTTNYYYGSTYNHHGHHHTNHCEHRVIVRNYERPRYVYYRDYDVYFDNRRNVYISFSGRNWRVSTSLPAAMCHINVRRAVCMEVEYYEDDFVHYLDSGRPVYRSVYYATR